MGNPESASQRYIITKTKIFPSYKIVICVFIHKGSLFIYHSLLDLKLYQDSRVVLRRSLVTWSGLGFNSSVLQGIYFYQGFTYRRSRFCVLINFATAIVLRFFYICDPILPSGSATVWLCSLPRRVVVVEDGECGGGRVAGGAGVLIEATVLVGVCTVVYRGYDTAPVAHFRQTVKQTNCKCVCF